MGKAKKYFKKVVTAPARVTREFFYDSDGTFNPVYFWTTICMTLIVVTWVIKLTGIQKVQVSDYLLLGLLTFVVVWIGLYNRQKKNSLQGMSSAVPLPPAQPTADPKVMGQVKEIVEKASVIETAIADKLKGGEGK